MIYGSGSGRLDICKTHFINYYTHINNIIRQIRQELRLRADEKTKSSGEHFFKEKVKLYGVKSATVGRIGKDFFKEIKGKKKEEIFSLCDELWQSGYMEESFVACSWSYYLHKDYEPKDFKVFEKWVSKYVENWASCDTLCNHTIGTFVDMYPTYLENLKKWAKSPNRWMRRAAAVSLIVPAKQGRFLPEVFEIADILLTDREDLVQKGYGWMLKVSSHIHEQDVFAYVMKNKKVMPRTALRYAIEKMPKDLKVKALAK